MRGAPQRIVNTHPPDQRAQIRGDLRSASKRAGFPTPVPAEAGPMPTHQGLGPDDCDRLAGPMGTIDVAGQEQAIPIRRVGHDRAPSAATRSADAAVPHSLPQVGSST